MAKKITKKDKVQAQEQEQTKAAGPAILWPDAKVSLTPDEIDELAQSELPFYYVRTGFMYTSPATVKRLTAALAPLTPADLLAPKTWRYVNEYRLCFEADLPQPLRVKVFPVSELHPQQVVRYDMEMGPVLDTLNHKGAVFTAVRVHLSDVAGFNEIHSIELVDSEGRIWKREPKTAVHAVPGVSISRAQLIQGGYDFIPLVATL